MSDFFNNFWSVYIAAVSLIGILGCFLLLVLVARRKVVPSADNTTGHVWDEDLRELNNPMPKWWMGLFVITVVFSLAYLVAYPGLGSYKGELDWTQYGAYDKEMEKARVDLEPMYAKFVSMPTEEMAKDPQAMAIGERLFMNNCAQCHGSDARGSKSFPNLSDGDWLHGGTPDKIKETITNGRIGVMPPMAAAVGSAEDVRNVAHYVLSLSGSPHDAVKASQGKSKFVACAACHGMDGKGNQALGAPNLTDDIWLHGWGESVIVDMVNHGKMNEMPAQKDKLTEAQIAVLASYVWGLSNASAQK
ncbi:MAG: cytochrome-c oxidase, cbb3-type subunit III [Comamonas sp.]|jgi:cytochrome c oxidase cbb3-type subunit 3|uniref:cytochrome-c oxidase, cbb3-type subunit III n=1 Tax=Comamonas sp. TaxID=34028 RepID=UPI0028425060|nr:cytochrome-c oxidase, cbb3-type subunit III [Comamonas sp.]MDR3066053.1 cytochrome-c oxidase, cbb3-type subunit III [Comamonas sp.]